ncbi:hypothetical protein cand_029490 [Cryptosporidium andersoni]|uniref:Coiled-coil domain-containing protein 86 n=1 Tax=Cryptosporidium andersoni TaxID=117008 RepID=A0A1J4MNF5_9CRYT|nr:hypothetical protein cand_029490 [Cryptosporidium andersoni]
MDNAIFSNTKFTNTSRISGRQWKDEEALKSKLKTFAMSKRVNFKNRLIEREERKRVHLLEKSIHEEIKSKKRAKTRNTELKYKRKIEFEMRSSGIQVIKKTENIRRWNKKARNLLRTVSPEFINSIT